MTAPILETPRLILRPLKLSDAETIRTLAGDRAIAATTLHIPHPYPQGAAEDFIQASWDAMAAEQAFTFGVVRKSDHTFLGCVGLHMDDENASAEIGYWMGVPYWGQGYTTEAARRLVVFGFEEQDLNRIFARHFTTNPASGRVMQKIGMQYEGTLRHDVVKWGEFIDIAFYSILRSEYET